MFNNLKAEMARSNLTQKNISEVLDVDEKTVSSKLNNKSKFNVDEMWLIKNNLFPTLTLDYLFEKFNN